MSPLSPAAQAAIDAAWKGVPAGMRDPYVVRCEQIAAALRVLADRLAPESPEPARTLNTDPERDFAFIGAWHIWNRERIFRQDLAAIAAELETGP